MWIPYPSRVDSASAAVEAVSALPRALVEDFQQYVALHGLSWEPDGRIVSAPRAGVEISYVDRYGTVCPVALFRVCPPNEGPAVADPAWWLHAVGYSTPLGDSPFRMLVSSAAGWLTWGALASSSAVTHQH